MDAPQLAISPWIRSSRLWPSLGTSSTQWGSRPRAINPPTTVVKSVLYLESKGTLRKTFCRTVGA